MKCQFDSVCVINDIHPYMCKALIAQNIEDCKQYHIFKARIEEVKKLHGDIGDDIDDSD